MAVYTLAFDFICIVLAAYMTWKQVNIYLKNEDFSEISFKRFTEGTGYHYPTYTICLEDSNLQQIYRTTGIKTKKNCPEDRFSQSSLCPYGCYITKENENLIIWNKTDKERCPKEAQSFQTLGPPFPPFLDSVPESDQPPLPPFDYNRSFIYLFTTRMAD